MAQAQYWESEAAIERPVPRFRTRNGNGDGGGGNGESEPPGPPLNPNLRVAAIECTQATQYFNINGQGTGLAPDNSIPLITNKTTIFRVYPDIRQVSSALPVPTQITADLTVFRINWPPPPEIITLTPINGPIAVAPGAGIQRANADHTLNFRLPAWKSRPGSKGTMVVSAGIRDAGLTGPAPYYVEGLSQYTPPFIDPTPLPIFAVRIIYTGPDNTGAPMRIGPPSELEMLNTLTGSFVTKSYPRSGITYVGHTVAEFGGDLSGKGSGGVCGPGWVDLLRMLNNMQIASGKLGIAVGFLPIGAPEGAALGCGWTGAAAGFVSSPLTVAGRQAQATMAQEIGHALGRQHAQCANTASYPDPGYPAYTTGPAGSIGEVGFDASTGQTLRPLQTSDFMSYCSPVWVSPYTYQALLNLSFIL